MISARSKPILNGELERLCAVWIGRDLRTDQRLLERFLERDDPEGSGAAFAELVSRHGPMVLGVCRQALPSLDDAHDAFQATFLVLVRKDSAIQVRGSLAGWLFGIAMRVAARARVEAARRQRHLDKLKEQRTARRVEAAAPCPADPEVDYGPLLEGVDGLPERFRSVVVLHYFEGLSTEVIAVRLGCARGTVLSRLARARARLAAPIWSNGASHPRSSCRRPARRAVSSTRRCPPCSSRPRSARATVPPSPARPSSSSFPTWSRDCRGTSLRSLAFKELRLASLMLLLLTAGAAAGFVTTVRARDDPQRRVAGVANQPATLPAPSTAKDVQPEPGRSIVIRGRVVDPGGSPVKDARVILSLPQPSASDIRGCTQLATSGADGRFQAVVPRDRIVQLEQLAAGRIEPNLGPILGAVAPDSRSVGSGPTSRRSRRARSRSRSPRTTSPSRDASRTRRDSPSEGRSCG